MRGKLKDKRYPHKFNLTLHSVSDKNMAQKQRSSEQQVAQ